MIPVLNFCILLFQDKSINENHIKYFTNYLFYFFFNLCLLFINGISQQSQHSSSCISENSHCNSNFYNPIFLSAIY